MPSSTKKSKVANRVMPESDAIARLQIQLGEYDQKVRAMSNDLADKTHLAEHLVRIADEAISFANSAQQAMAKAMAGMDNNNAAFRYLSEFSKTAGRTESWMRQMQGEIRRLMS